MHRGNTAAKLPTLSLTLDKTHITLCQYQMLKMVYDPAAYYLKTMPCTICPDSILLQAIVVFSVQFHSKLSMHINRRVCVSARPKANAWFWYTSYLFIIIQLDSAFNFPFELGEVAIPLLQ